MNPIVPSTDNWSRQVAALWQDKCGGPPRVWHMKELKPLVDRHGVDVVKRVLSFYLEKTETQYISLPSFISKFGAWHRQAIPQYKTNTSRFVPH